MDLNALWFGLLTVLFIGFFFLEGFDYGVGILLPFMAKEDVERRILINTIGPLWDGNEVWMLTAGGAMFAAFPHWYATMFSGFYLALFLMLAALIVRGVAFEFRSKDASPFWRNAWDWTIFFGSLIPALLWGVAMANLIKGVPIGADMEYVGSFWDLLSPYTLWGGVTGLLIFIFHGALFLTLKVAGPLEQRAQRTAGILGVLALIALILFTFLSWQQTDLLVKTGAKVLLLGAIVTVALAWWLAWRKSFGLAMAANALTIILSTTALFWGLFPRVMVSSLDPQYSLTIYNASSSPYTLKVMTMVALTLIPVVLAYQAWTYWVFRRRLSGKEHLEY